MTAFITSFGTWSSAGARINAAPAGPPGTKLGDWPEAPPLSQVHPRARRPHPQAKAMVQLAGAIMGTRRITGMGVCLGTSSGCYTPDVDFQKELDTKGKALGSPSLFVYTLPTASVGEVGIALGANGPGFTVDAGAASAFTALALAAEEVSSGRAPAMLAGTYEWGTGADVAALFLIEPTGAIEVTGRQGFGSTPAIAPGDALTLASQLSLRTMGKSCSADPRGFWAELELRDAR